MNYKILYPLSLVGYTCALSTPICAQTTKDTTKPNVIIILADDLGYGDLGCYGAKNVHTPNTDKLANQGLRLTNLHACASTSTPSRYSILTGEYPFRKKGTDVAPGDAGMIIRAEQYTLADAFKSAGYSTASIGKWHLGLGDTTGSQDWNTYIPANPADLGFDYHYIMAATADRVPCVMIENGQIANWDKDAPVEVSYYKPFKGEPTGKNNPELLYNLKSSHGHDMAIVNGIGRIGFSKGGGKALWKDENIADSITFHAVNFIKQNKDKPFFLYFATNDVHVPRFPHKRFRGHNKMGLRGDAIEQFDWSVGKIMQTLDSLGIADNTLIVLSSDNGPVLDDGYADNAEELTFGHKPSGPFRGKKYSSFEGGTMVPGIVRWPLKIKGGSTSNALLSQVDWLQSFASLINARVPKHSAIDSENHINGLLGRPNDERDYVVEQSTSHVLAVRTNKWKYISPSNGPKMIPWAPNIETGNLPTPQLYDIQNDVQEQHNIAPIHKDIVEKLKAILDKVLHKL